MNEVDGDVIKNVISNLIPIVSETEVEQEVDAVNARVIDISGLFNQHCDGSTALTNIQSNFSPYLYPFSVEFNILIGLYFCRYNNHMLCRTHFYTFCLL